MKHIPWILISNDHITIAGEPEQRVPLPAQESGFPRVGDIIAALPETIWSHEKLAVGLRDDMLYPLKVDLEEEGSAKERNHFLLWKLKKLLPLPVENAVVRYLPGDRPKRYIAFTLGKTWVDQLCNAFEEKGVQLGYIGPTYASALTAPRGTESDLLLLKDFYLYQSSNEAHGFTVRCRRYPLDETDKVDVAGLLKSDFLPLRGEGEGKPRLLAADPSADPLFTALGQQAQTRENFETITLNGGEAARRTALFGDFFPDNRLNFSTRPFPFRDRVLTSFWTLNLVLAALVVLALIPWVHYRNKNQQAHQTLETISAERRETARDAESMLRTLEEMDLRVYRKKVDQFDDVQTALRTHWGPMLDTLSELLNEDTRILSLRPAQRGRNDRSRRETVIEVSAEARHKDAQIAFFQALQEHTAFENVFFSVESYEAGSDGVAFEITFTYLPGGV